MPRLIDLEPEWLRYEKRADGRVYFVPSDMANAHGIKFLCPKCFAEKPDGVGIHSVICWSRSRGTPDDAEPGPGRWTFGGERFDNLSLHGDPPGNPRSVQLNGGCGWHGYVTEGEAA
jgi:hypothetical protein